MIHTHRQCLGLSAHAAVIKIGDTPADIAEGRAAGAWTIGVALTGNALGLARAAKDALLPPRARYPFYGCAGRFTRRQRPLCRRRIDGERSRPARNPCAYPSWRYRTCPQIKPATTSSAKPNESVIPAPPRPFTTQTDGATSAINSLRPSFILG